MLVLHLTHSCTPKHTHDALLVHIDRKPTFDPFQLELSLSLKSALGGGAASLLDLEGSNALSGAIPFVRVCLLSKSLLPF